MKSEAEALVAASTDDDPYHVVGSLEHSTAGTRVLKVGDTFLVMNRSGEIRPGDTSDHGLFFHGTRHLCCYRLAIGRHRLLTLSSNVAMDNLLLEVHQTNPDIFDGDHRTIPYGTLHVARSIYVDEGRYSEKLMVTNYGAKPVTSKLDLEMWADFADIFEVRGTKRARRGEQAAPLRNGSATRFDYRGLDGVLRSTWLELDPSPVHFDGPHAFIELSLDALESQCVKLRVDCEHGDRAPSYEPRRSPKPHDELLARAQKRREQQVHEECHIETSNELFNEWLNRSRADLRMLLTRTPHGLYPYAGVPWFSTPFGRDGLWTALQTLWMNPSIGRGVLKFLAAHQAKSVDADADAQPGKILHEMRDGEMAALGEVPFKCYYGSVDSTPLFLMLADRYQATTGDLALIQELWPNLVAAAQWIETYGDSNGDGFIDYGIRANKGLVQQGWKDSHDSVFRSDGLDAPGPIALCEVQGYAYAALRGMGRLSALLNHTTAAQGWLARADDLRQRFDTAFWSESIGAYALALDGEGRQCDVLTSNAGQCLYTGIALPERVDPLVEQLMSPRLFTGWGIRTLAEGEPRYNPISYHNGSVWPHDTAVIAEGLSQCGERAQASRVLGAMFDVSLFMEMSRLPELFCGFSRQPSLGPTRYPVACAPQAWASGAAFALLRGVLGLQVQGASHRVSFKNPVLPAFVKEVRLHRLPVGSGFVDIRLVRQGDDVALTVLRATREVEVMLVK